MRPDRRQGPQARSDRPLVINTVLFIAIVVAANVGAARIAARADLTTNREYSLTPLTREVLLQADQPVRFRLFFSDNLPPQYESAFRHLVDLLQEYRRSATTPLGIQFPDVEEPAVIREAEALGVGAVEIQQIESDQYASRSVYMAVVIEYAGLVEIINPVTERYGVEYRLTDGLARMVRRQQAYAGSDRPLEVTFLATPGLDELGVSGISRLEQAAGQTLETLGTTAGLPYSLESVQVAEAEVDRLAAAYDLPRIRWLGEDGAERAGLLAVIIGADGTAQSLPIAVRRAEDGSVQTESPFSLQRRIVRAVDVVTGVIPRIGYVTGHGEPSLTDMQSGAGAFRELASGRYDLVEVALALEDIPPDLSGLVVTTPTERWPPESRRRLAAYLENGGNLLAMVDPYVLVRESGEAEPRWTRTDPGLLEILAGWGVTITNELVLDERSFVAEQDGVRRRLYQAPVVRGRDLDRSHPVTRGLDDIILFNPAALRQSRTTEDYTVLLRSSGRSWTSTEPRYVGPWVEAPPANAAFGSRDLAVLVPSGGPAAEGAIIVLGTTALTAAPMLGGIDRLTNRILVENLLDTIAGYPGFAELRSKGVAQPRLDVTTPGARLTARILSVSIPAALFAAAAGIVMLARRRRRAGIRKAYGGPS